MAQFRTFLHKRLCLRSQKNYLTILRAERYFLFLSPGCRDLKFYMMILKNVKMGLFLGFLQTSFIIRILIETLNDNFPFFCENSLRKIFVKIILLLLT